MPETTPSAAEVAISRWRAELVAATGQDALIDYRDLPASTLDLATAHPSGLAQFLAGRPTRLSELFRAPSALSAARERARAIRLAAARLRDQHGIGGSYLASGMASWQAAGRHVQAPVLLRPLTLRPTGPGQADDDLDLAAAVRINPSLLRSLAEQHVQVDPQHLVALAAGEHGFNPRPVLASLRETASHLDGFAARERTVIGVFVDVLPTLLDGLGAFTPAIANHPVAGPLAVVEARLARAPGAEPADATWSSNSFAPVPLTVPFAALTLDPDQRRVVQAVVDGYSARVAAPPGSGATRLLAQMVVTQAALGRRTLLVSPHRAELTGVVDVLDELGLGALVHDPGGLVAVPPAAVPAAAVPAAATPPAATHAETAPPNGDAASDESEALAALTELADARAALHRPAQPWGVSVSQALHALARLTSISSGPRTTVRLAPEAAARLTGERRTATAKLLSRLAELGGFEASAENSPWFGAELTDEDDARRALEAARRPTRKGLPRLRAEMLRIAGAAGLTGAVSLADCGRQIDLLVAVRGTLDTFTANVYERSVADMVNATATRQWRDDRGLSMSALERRRWKRQARELLRPGRQPADLHGALVRAQTERIQWQQVAAGGGWPRVPAGLAEADDAYQSVLLDVRVLDRVLASTEAGAGLAGLPLEDLAARLERLAAEDSSSTTLPDRVALTARLRDAGLVGLLADLRGRRVSKDLVGDELELCWWASVLEHELAGAPLLATGSDGVRRYERAQQLAWRSAAAAVGEMSGSRADGVCTVVSPLSLPQHLPAGLHFDLVIIAGAHLCGVPEGVLAMARADQALVVGDPRGLPPGRLHGEGVPGEDVPGEDVPGEGRQLGAEASVAERASVLQATGAVLPSIDLTHQHRMPAQLARVSTVPPAWSVPAPGGRVGLELVSDGTGPLDAEGIVQSVDAEIRRVADLVFEHARTTPNLSLAVLTVTRHHARRIADAVRAELPGHPDAAGFFTRPSGERFVITDLAHCEDAVRDVVLLSVGYGLTPHARVLHSFGPLDADTGGSALAVGASRARRRTTVVSCFTADDLDPEKLRTPGARSLRELLLIAANGPDDEIEDDAAPLDPLLGDLQKRLAQKGLAARPCHRRPGWPDLVVRPESGRPVALLTDSRWASGGGSRASSELVLDEQSVAGHLRRFGWQVVRLSSLDLFTDADAAVAAMLDASR